MWLKALLVVNSIALIGLLIAAIVLPVFTDLDVRLRFTELDRAGVINDDKLGQFHPTYEFTAEDLGYRSTVPRYIAKASLSRERWNAIYGAMLAGVNCCCLTCAWLSIRRTQGHGFSEEGT